MSHIGGHMGLGTTLRTAGQFLQFFGKNKLSHFNVIWITFRTLLELSKNCLG